MEGAADVEDNTPFQSQTGAAPVRLIVRRGEAQGVLRASALDYDHDNGTFVEPKPGCSWPIWPAGPRSLWERRSPTLLLPGWKDHPQGPPAHPAPAPALALGNPVCLCSGTVRVPTHPHPRKPLLEGLPNSRRPGWRGSSADSRPTAWIPQGHGPPLALSVGQ